MSIDLQFSCGNQRRLQAVREHPTLNAIDYLEVLGEDAPPGIAPQQTLLVRCVKPLPPGLNAGNVRIEGGVRVTPIRVVWAGAADALTTPPVPPAEVLFLAGLPEPDHLLVVRTDSSGDFSAYHLSIQQSPTDPSPPAGFDLVLSSLDFSFKVDCPSEFDCAPAGACPPETVEEPSLNYLAKDYASFRQLVLDRLAVITPDWRERNAADVGIAVVELLAHAGDLASYYQDSVATEAYLGTARRRPSVRRHARLLDYPMHDGCNARAWVHLQVDRSGVDLPAGTRLLTRVDAPSGAYPPLAFEDAISAGAEVFETMHDVTLYDAQNEIHFYTWRDEECCLPEGATRATLADPEGTLLPGDVLVFEEVLSPITGLPEDADPGHRHAVRIRSVTPLTDPLDGTPVVQVEWREADALPFPLCISARAGVGPESALISNVSLVRGNIVLADHGRTIGPEDLEPPEAPGSERYRPRLRRTGLTFRMPYQHDRATAEAAAAALVQEPREALPAVSLAAGGTTWLPQRDLLASGRFLREFVVEPEEDGRAFLRFGDGVLGARPPAETIFDAVYRVGSGAAGNVGAGAIAHAVTLDTGITGCRNPLPAVGGTQPERLEEVRLYAPQAFRTQERAVTEADYAAMAERHPDVQRAVARFRWTGSWYTVFVTVDRKRGRIVDGDFETEMLSFLEPFRMAGHDIEIDGPTFVPLDIAFTVCVAPGYRRPDVKARLFEVFSTVPLAGGSRGFFHPDNFTFGQPVYLSNVVATAMSVEGVHWVDVDDTPPKPNHFRRWGEASLGELGDGLIGVGPLQIIRLDNDPNAPENGKIDFFMTGGL